MRTLLLLTLAACASAPNLTPVDQAPPPGALTSTVVVSGSPFTLRIATGVPGARVGFVAARSQPEPGACPPLLGGQCLGLVGTWVVGDVVSDAQGEASLTRNLPLRPGSLVSVQAVVFGPNGVALSEAVTQRVLDPVGDLDLDGLTAADEVAFGTNLFDADSDGGGTIDGQEVLSDHTNAVDPADDLGFEVDCDDKVDGDGDGARDCGDADCACPEVCGNGLDDDHQGDGDCEDRACAGAAACAEICGDGVDNNANQAADAEDDACTTSPWIERLCADTLDNDGDGLGDCADPDCSIGHAGCPTAYGEVCTDGVDNNRNRMVDCQDSDCRYESVCAEECDNGIDDNADGRIDCADWGCWGAPNCREDCFDGADNDADAQVDQQSAICVVLEDPQPCGDGRTAYRAATSLCDEYECRPACFEDCTDGVDNDLDLDIDCADDDCAPTCREACADAVDNDADALTDCLDPDCADRCVERCHNGADDNFNGRADCADPDCACVEVCDNGVDDDLNGSTDCADPACGGTCGEVCDNGIDDDGDGLADCEDGSCVDLCGEDCSNGVDDNGDAWVDCQDEGCWDDPTCPAPKHLAWVTDGHLDAQQEDEGRGRWWAPQPCGPPDVVHDRGTATGVRGFVRVGHAGRQALCSWAVDRAEIRHLAVTGIVSTTYRSSSWTGPPAACVPGTTETWTITREGFRVANGCGPLASSEILPDRLNLRVSPQIPYPSNLWGWTDSAPGSASAFVPGGARWYAGGVGVGHVDYFSDVSGVHTLDAETGPLAPAGAFGTCPSPALRPTQRLMGGQMGVCVP